MIRNRQPSTQMKQVLAALSERGADWSHGYDLMKQTGLSSGTLYPLLMRMTDKGLVEADWHAPAVPGRPSRHVYRLTAAGALLARDMAERDMAAQAKGALA